MKGDRGNWGLYALLALGVAMVVGGFVVEQLPELPEAQPVADSFTPPPTTPLTPAPAAPSPAEPAPAAPPRHDEEVTLVWNAEVVGGDRLAAGTPCALALRVARRLAGPQAMRAMIDCDAERVFDGDVVRQELWEVPLDGVSFAHRADVSAVRVTNAGRVTLEGHTAEHRARVVGPRGVVELYVEDLSSARAMDPLWTANEGRSGAVQRPLRRLAVPLSIEGDAPPAVRAAQASGLRPTPGAPRCELFGGPVPNDQVFNCRLVVRCGDTLLYGAGSSGYNRCEVEGGSIVGAIDEGTSPVDTDAAVTLNVGARILRVSDEKDGASFSAMFALAYDPGCDLGGQWTGAALARSGAALTWRLAADPDADSASLVSTGGGIANGERQVTASLDCDAGQVVLDTRSASLPELSLARYTLTFGPSFRTLSGGWRAGADDAGALWGQRR